MADGSRPFFQIEWRHHVIIFVVKDRMCVSQLLYSIYAAAYT